MFLKMLTLEHVSPCSFKQRTRRKPEFYHPAKLRYTDNNLDGPTICTVGGGWGASVPSGMNLENAHFCIYSALGCSGIVIESESVALVLIVQGNP